MGGCAHGSHKSIEKEMEDPRFETTKKGGKTIQKRKLDGQISLRNLDTSSRDDRESFNELSLSSQGFLNLQTNTTKEIDEHSNNTYATQQSHSQSG